VEIVMKEKSRKEDTNKESVEASFDGMIRELTMEEILLVSVGGGKSSPMPASSGL
jgi:hypothetical protein